MSGRALIESIAKGAEKLIGDNRRLRAEIEKLEAAKEKLREENRRLVSENEALERRVIVKDLATGFSGGAARTGRVTQTGGDTPTGRGTLTGAAPNRHDEKIARVRVNRLLREVDRCIALLNKE
jgi:hypothetical protein